MLDLLTVGGVALVAGYALGRARSPRPTPRAETETSQRRTQPVFCTACETPFDNRAAAYDHARDVHNAPTNEAADHIINIPDTGGDA